MAHTPFFEQVKKLMAQAAKANAEEASLQGLGSKPWTRRQFLRTTGQVAALAGALPLLNACGSMSGTTKGRPMDIAIVGAGLAGLNAARHLKRAGYMATIYEASKRPGGRVLTGRDVLAPGLTVELGAEFIDTSHADIMELVKEFDLPLMDCHAPSEKALKGESYYFGGKIRSTEEVVQALRPLVERIAQDAGKIEDEKALADFDKLSLAQYFDSIGAKGWIRDLLNVAMTTEMGSDIGDQTALNILWILPTVTDTEVSLLGTSDERYKVRGGNELLVDGLVAGLKDQIKLEAKLEAVRQAGEKYKLSFKGFEVEADAVILALPFTILRTITIEAPLEPGLRTFIKEAGYGMNAKVLAGFTNRLWREQGYVGAFYGDESFQLAWDNSQL
ncbi:MAG: flavin monoamine oxidase family protein, partial [Planctomycetota bacterium]